METTKYLPMNKEISHMEYYSAFKKEILTYGTMWMKLKDIRKSLSYGKTNIS
jgi:hypothetical protein